jgi:hypothetical protein
MLEAFQQHFHRDGLATEVAAQERAGRRNAPIVSGPQSTPSGAGSHWGIDLPHPGRRPAPQIGLVCDFGSALEGPLRQSPFGQGLQAPSHAAEQLILVFRARLFAKQLAVLLAQAAERGVAQFLDLSESGCIHVFVSSSVGVVSPTPDMNALTRTESNSQFAMPRPLSQIRTDVHRVVLVVE